MPRSSSTKTCGKGTFYHLHEQILACRGSSYKSNPCLHDCALIYCRDLMYEYVVCTWTLSEARLARPCHPERESDQQMQTQETTDPLELQSNTIRCVEPRSDKVNINTPVQRSLQAIQLVLQTQHISSRPYILTNTESCVKQSTPLQISM